MTVEEKAYNYASKVAKNRLTASEIAAHYGRGYIEGQEDMKHLGWHPASELPRKPSNGIGKIIVITFDDEYGVNNYANGWYMDNIKWWCYPPKEE